MRLSASLATIERRLSGRETGEALAWHRRRAAELAALMERNRVEDLVVDTEGRSPADVAREVVTRGNWFNPPEPSGPDTGPA